MVHARLCWEEVNELVRKTFRVRIRFVACKISQPILFLLGIIWKLRKDPGCRNRRSNIIRIREVQVSGHYRLFFWRKAVPPYPFLPYSKNSPTSWILRLEVYSMVGWFDSSAKSNVVYENSKDADHACCYHLFSMLRMTIIHCFHAALQDNVDDGWLSRANRLQVALRFSVCADQLSYLHVS